MILSFARMLSVLLCLHLLLPAMQFAQQAPQNFASEKIVHLCRVWGLAKYFHPRIADCELSWDDALLRQYPRVMSAVDENTLRSELVALLDLVGEVPMPQSEAENFPDRERILFDLSWIDGDFYTGELGRRLRQLRDFVRCRQHCLVTAEPGTYKPDFDDDDRYYDPLDAYPPEALRMLALCRFWNAFKYYSPYRDLPDRSWHEVLETNGVRWVHAPDTLSYHVAIFQTALEVCDGHAGIGSTYLSEFLGMSMAPFMLKRIDNVTVVERSLVPNIRPGDIVRSVDGVPLASLRDSLAPYCDKTNPHSFEYVLGYRIARGAEGPSEVVLEGRDGVRTESFERSSGNNAVFYKPFHPLHFDTVLANGAHVGYIDVVHLEKADVRNVMTAHRADDALVFDVRGYPQGAIIELAKYLLPFHTPVALFSNANANYPGMLQWQTASFGGNGNWTYMGPIYVLHDESAISHAEYTCMIFEAAPNCTTVGSPTRGSDGNVTWIYVPGGVQITFTGLGVYYPDGRPTQRLGIQPDIFVRPTVEGLRDGRDEVLEAALQAISTTGTRHAPLARHPGLDLYPSPVREQLTCRIQGGDGSSMLEVADVLGRIVFRTQVSLSDGATVHIPVRDLPAGTYLLRVLSPGAAAARITHFVKS